MATPMLNCCSFQKGMYLPNGIGPTDSCPPIIQTVADISLAVDGTVTGQLTVERYIDDAQNQHVHLYEWDGADWILLIDSSSLYYIDEGFRDFQFQPSSIIWECSVDEGVTWFPDSTIVFDPPVTSITVWFRNTVNGCVYTNLPIIPLEITYCVEYSLFDNSGDPTFLFGTINGADAGDAVAVAATYANWEGNPTAIATYDNSITPALISIFRDSLTPQFVNFGVFQDILANPPVTIPIDTVSCISNCYQAVFTVDDLATDSFTGVTFNNNTFDITFDSPLIDPTTAAAAYLAGLISANMLEPTATINITLNGNEVTMTICTVRVLVSGEWSDNPVTHSGTFNFNLI
jgi:hypothetical protein